MKNIELPIFFHFFQNSTKDILEIDKKSNYKSNLIFFQNSLKFHIWHLGMLKKLNDKSNLIKSDNFW